jgi:predicted ATPase/DNA-binding SARP family transcriptional activator
MPDTDPLRVAILGPLEVRGQDRGLLEVPGRRLRALLIRLALEPGRPVSAERLIDDLWREDPPAAANNALQALVSRLRAVLGRTAIESGGGGYRLKVPADAVDVVRFEQGVRAARGRLDAGDADGAVKLLREALGLWRGDALADVEGEPFADAARTGLEAKRVAAIEALTDAALASGAAGEINALLPELEQLRAAYPFREGLHGGYMRLLYATGRHAEALAAYEQLRSTLADRLGVDPSPETARLHLAILRQDPELPTVTPSSSSGATTTGGGGDANAAAAPASAITAASGAGAPSAPGAAGGPSSTSRSTAASPHPATAPPTGAAASADTAAVGAAAFAGSATTGRPAAAPAASASSADLVQRSADATARVVAARTRGNLPAQLTSFIGREAELELVASLLTQSRLVTLVGPGGAGKTRLAQESGAGIARGLADGVWFVPLASVADGNDVPQAVLTALGGDESLWLTTLALERLDAASKTEHLCSMLAGRDPLLILDNCEHVIDDVAELVDVILSAAPGVRVLATSREPLALTGEALCPVASLALPPEDPGPGLAGSPSSGRPEPVSCGGGLAAEQVESALDYAAVRLLAERARAVRPGFAVNEANVAAVTRICRALDGIPLAIELAAARLRSLTAQQVADRLDDRFRLLSSGSRTALPRHQTLRAIVDWSWELLSGPERAVLARLSVFAGGATPEAAARVCSTGDEPAAVEAEGVVDVIASLVDKSLVVAQEDEAGDVRYRLLETVRAYAAERLAEGGDPAAAVVRDAHARHFLELAEHADPHLRGAEQLGWILRLTLERDNSAAALRHVVAAEDAESALRFFQALTWFWLMRNYEADAAQWSAEIHAMLERTGFEVPDHLREAYMLCEGERNITTAFREQPGDLNVVAQALIESLPPESLRARHPMLAIARPIAGLLGGHGVEAGQAESELEALADHPDPWVRAVRHTFAGLLLLHRARPEEAEAALRAGYAAHKEIGDRLGLMFTLIMLSQLSIAHGRFEQALRQAEEASGYASEGISGDSGSFLLVQVGQARALAGEPEAGRRLMEMAATSAERLGEYGEAAGGYAELAALALREGDRAEARRRLAQATSLLDARSEDRERARMGLAYSTVTTRSAYLAALDGEFEAARQYLREALEAVSSGPFLSFMSGFDEVVRGLAGLASLEGDHVRAAELLGSAFAVVGMGNVASYSDARTRAAAVAALGEEAFTAAFERGRRLGKPEILALGP